MDHRRISSTTKSGGILPPMTHCLRCPRAALTGSDTCAEHLTDAAAFRDAALARLRADGGHLHVYAGVDWRGADLSGLRLEHADFSGADLRGVRFDAADLSRTNLRRARLVEASFVGAQLQVANLQDVDATRARFTDARLEGTWLSGADLTSADLERARLVGANLKRARLVDANFRGADLFRASLSGADLLRTDFRGAHLRDVGALDVVNVESVLMDATTQRPEALRGTTEGGTPGRRRGPTPSSFVWRPAPPASPSSDDAT